MKLSEMTLEGLRQMLGGMAVSKDRINRQRERATDKVSAAESEQQDLDKIWSALSMAQEILQDEINRRPKPPSEETPAPKPDGPKPKVDGEQVQS